MPIGTNRLEIGHRAPKISIKADNTLNSAESFEEKYTFINFWSVTDPASRIRNKRLHRLASESDSINVVSICVDKDTILSREVMKIDGVAGNGINVSLSQIDEKVMKDYQTDTGLRCYMIDPEGKLIKATASFEDLSIPS